MYHEEPAERFTVDGLVVRIYPDQTPSDPREDDNLAVMVCAHNRYDLGDRKPDYMESEAVQRGGYPLLVRYLRATRGVRHILPLALYDHSGITMYVGSGPHALDARGWDSGMVGFIYIDDATIAAEGTPENRVDACLRGEVETYDQFLRGDVYGYVVTRPHCEDDECPHAEVLDSCWGFFGTDYVMEAARDAARCEAYGPAIDYTHRTEA